MRIRSFIIAYALVLAILLFADRRPHPIEPGRYSHVVDLTDAQDGIGRAAKRALSDSTDSRTRIIAPDDLIPGTWKAGQIPAERLIAPLVVLELRTTGAGNTPSEDPLSLDDIAAWETAHGNVPQGAVVAIRHREVLHNTSNKPLAITAEAAQFLMDARYTTGFVSDAPAAFGADRSLARQLARHGNYVVERAKDLRSLPATGSLIIVAPAKGKTTGTPVRVLAMVQ